MSPAFQVKAAAGELMTGFGGVFPAPAVTGPTTADTAVLVPPAFVAVTTTRNVVPWSASWGE